ncbi:hypothetical protein [Niastella vici]|nr:hypothetical protein [Niastella vici]
MQVLFYGIDSLFLQWFFIGYWILKTGLDVYPGPFLFLYLPVPGKPAKSNDRPPVNDAHVKQ